MGCGTWGTDMRILNLQDGVVKSPLVQQIQGRAAEVARTQDASHVAFNDELARQADEVVLQTNQAENDGIRDKEEREGRQRRRRKRQTGKTHDDDSALAAGKNPDHSGHASVIDITV